MILQRESIKSVFQNQLRLLAILQKTLFHIVNRGYFLQNERLTAR